MMYALVLAGGSGTRLWPHSRSHRPKQFLSLGGGRTMLQETVDRTLPIIPPERVFVATGAAYVDLVAEQLPEVPRENIIAEPSGRGTAPCIGLAALMLRRRDPEAVMAVLSADHRVEQEAQFCEVLCRAADFARAGYLVTLGITPDAPSSGYGYIRRGDALDAGEHFGAFRVGAFVEKPDTERARGYLASGDYYWNAGMFVWRADRVLEELGRHRPALSQQLAIIDAALGTASEQAVVEAVWPGLENVAIDVAVMEQTDRAAVIPADLGWSDVGDWAALADSLPQDDDGNAVVGSYVGVETYNSLIYGNGRVVATIGVENLLIVDTHDVLLVCPKDRAQDVKTMVARIRERHSGLV